MGNLEFIEKVYIETYDGTLESALKIIDSYNLEPHQYFLNVKNRQITIFPIGLILRPGDVYHLPREPEIYEAIK